MRGVSVGAPPCLTAMPSVVGELAQQAPAPSPAEGEDAIAAVRRTRNPTFVEFRRSAAGRRTLVIGVPPSPQDVENDLVADFEGAYDLLERRGWLSSFSAIELVVPQPLMRVSAELQLIRSLKEHVVTRMQFQTLWHRRRLAAP